MSFQLNDFMKKRLERKVFTGLPLTIFIIVFVLLLATFLGITDSIVNSSSMVKIDNTFTHYLFNLRTPALANFFYVVTSFGGQAVIIFLLLVASLYLFFKKEMAYLYALLLTFIGTEGSVFLIKIFINRDRPGQDLAFYLEKSKSFPSGHSAASMAFYGFVTYYLMHHIVKRNYRTIAVICGTLVIGLIGFSRLYLGVHFLSDVLGGFLVGGLWLVAGITFRERHFYIDSLKKGKNT